MAGADLFVYSAFPTSMFKNKGPEQGKSSNINSYNVQLHKRRAWKNKTNTWTYEGKRVSKSNGVFDTEHVLSIGTFAPDTPRRLNDGNSSTIKVTYSWLTVIKIKYEKMKKLNMLYTNYWVVVINV